MTTNTRNAARPAAPVSSASPIAPSVPSVNAHSFGLSAMSAAPMRNARPADTLSIIAIHPGGGASSSGWLVALRAAITRNRIPTTRSSAPSTRLVPG